MDPTKSNVVKSKSSNSAIDRKSEKASNKKSRSNAEFHRNTLKKQGVYVDTLGNSQKKHQGKPPPRPKRGNKVFLSNVLTLLSKSTIYTQYPDRPEATKSDKKKTKLPKVAKKNPKPEEKRHTDECTQDDFTRVAPIKPKYRSKILNLNLATKDDPVVVVQSKKEIQDTPSNYSEKSYKEIVDPRKWLDLPPLVKIEDSDDEVTALTDSIEKNMNNRLTTGLAAEIAEGKKRKKEKTVTIEGPAPAEEVNVTSQNNNSSQKNDIPLKNDTSQKNDKGLVNFFVDLLQNTISGYDLDTEYIAAPSPSETETKNALEIDEMVAKKLNVGKDTTATDHTSNKLYFQPRIKDSLNEEYFDSVPADTAAGLKYYSILDDEPTFFDHRLSLDRYNPQIKPKRKKIQSQSFYCSRHFRENSPRPSIAVMRKAPTKKKQKQAKTTKDMFMNMLKEQLQMDDTRTYEEPQNMFQALKAIAQNKFKKTHFEESGEELESDDYSKQKSQYRKTAHFDESGEELESDNYNHRHDCGFKRHKALSSGIRTKRKTFNQQRDLERSMINPKYYCPISRRYSGSTDIDMSKSSLTRNPKSIPNTLDTRTDYDPASCQSIEVHGMDYFEYTLEDEVEGTLSADNTATTTDTNTIVNKQYKSLNRMEDLNNKLIGDISKSGIQKMILYAKKSKQGINSYNSDFQTDTETGYDISRSGSDYDLKEFDISE